MKSYKLLKEMDKINGQVRNNEIHKIHERKLQTFLEYRLTKLKSDIQ